MNTNGQNLSPSEQGLVILTESDVTTEQLGGETRSVVSADQMEDVSFQANGQNQQNYQNN